MGCYVWCWTTISLCTPPSLSIITFPLPLTLYLSVPPPPLSICLPLVLSSPMCSPKLFLFLPLYSTIYTHFFFFHSLLPICLIIMQWPDESFKSSLETSTNGLRWNDLVVSGFRDKREEKTEEHGENTKGLVLWMTLHCFRPTLMLSF